MRRNDALQIALTDIVKSASESKANEWLRQLRLSPRKDTMKELCTKTLSVSLPSIFVCRDREGDKDT